MCANMLLASIALVCSPTYFVCTQDVYVTLLDIVILIPSLHSSTNNQPLHIYRCLYKWKSAISNRHISFPTKKKFLFIPKKVSFPSYFPRFKLVFATHFCADNENTEKIDLKSVFGCDNLNFVRRIFFFASIFFSTNDDQRIDITSIESRLFVTVYLLVSFLLFSFFLLHVILLASISHSISSLKNA